MAAPKALTVVDAFWIALLCWVDKHINVSKMEYIYIRSIYTIFSLVSIPVHDFWILMKGPTPMLQ